MKARIGDIDIHFEITGQGPWITLSHSLAAHSGMWAPQVRVLSPHFTVLCVDTRGHGGTDAPAGPYALEQLADDVHGLLAHLGVSRTHWLGLSMGGMIGQVLALRHPEVLDRVILADTSARGVPDAARMWAERAQAARTGGMAALVQPTLARWFTEPFRSTQPAQVQRVAETLRNTSAEGFAHCALALAHGQPAQAWADLQLPTLYIAGRHDQAVPSAHLKRYHACTPGAEWAELDGPHLLHLENPQGFASTVLDFLRRCET